MKTEIDFLNQLEEDLLRASRRRALTGVRRRTAPVRAITAAAAASLVAVGAVLVWILVPQSEGLRARDEAAGGAARMVPGEGEAQLDPSTSLSHGNYGLVEQSDDELQGFGGDRNDPSPEGAIPDVGPKVVKTARLELEIPEGEFHEQFGEASLVASRYGGFVSRSATEDSETPTGTLEVRVPAESFDRAVADLRRLGSVLRDEVVGEEVTARYVDLEARLLTWEAQEAVLLRLMGKAESVEASLRVRRELQNVQLEIERLTGQKRVLDDRISMGTILVSLQEEGEEKPAANGPPPLSTSLEEAVDGFFEVVGGVVTGIGYALPVTALLFVAWIVVHRVRRARGLT